LDKSTKKGLETLNAEKARVEAEKQKTQEKIEGITVNIALLDIAELIDEWYIAGNKTRFENDKNNLTKVEMVISNLKRNNNIEAEYYIYTTAQNTVVRVRKIGANSFYCLDSIQKQEQVISNNATFKSSTACSGQPLP